MILASLRWLGHKLNQKEKILDSWMPGEDKRAIPSILTGSSVIVGRRLWRKLNMAFVLMLAVCFFPAPDPQKKPAKKGVADIKGQWEIFYVTEVDGGVTLSRGPSLTIGDKTAEWDALPVISNEKGKGNIKVDSKKPIPTIELTIGEKVYKGIYNIRTNPGKPDSLQLAFSDAGGDFPKEFGDSPLKLPKDVKVRMSATRKK